MAKIIPLLAKVLAKDFCDPGPALLKLLSTVILTF